MVTGQLTHTPTRGLQTSQVTD